MLAGKRLDLCSYSCGFTGGTTVDAVAFGLKFKANPQCLSGALVQRLACIDRSLALPHLSLFLLPVTQKSICSLGSDVSIPETRPVRGSGTAVLRSLSRYRSRRVSTLGVSSGRVSFLKPSAAPGSKRDLYRLI